MYVARFLTKHRSILPTQLGVDPHFFTIGDTDVKFPYNGGHYPGPIVRIPRGVIYHGKAQGKGPPPHTIHWHGFEPTPINDGVGHCSMEFGTYIYQMQPNFIGTYFYHCHRNTVQHFEFGLFSLLIVEPPDAYFASIASVTPDGKTVTLNSIPVGACLDGKYRTAANLLTLPSSVRAKFPGFVGGDPVYGVAGANDVGVGPYHAFTVPYDVEVLWVPDDRDSAWSALAPHAFQTFPEHGPHPGVDDNFFTNFHGGSNFFAFNDFNPDYFFITGVQVPVSPGGTAAIPPNIVIPAALNSGRSGSQVSVNAHVGQTIFMRCLNAAYNNIRVTLPVDAICLEWDGRALGVPPYGHNYAYVFPANIPFEFSVARRCGLLIKAETAMDTFAKVEFINTRGGAVTATAQIPFTINP